MGSGEWDDADSYEIGNLYIYTMQDGTDLFICVVCTQDATEDAGDYCEIGFDLNDDGTLDASEDIKFNETDTSNNAEDKEDYRWDGSAWDSSWDSSGFNTGSDSDSGNSDYITYEFKLTLSDVFGSYPL